MIRRQQLAGVSFLLFLFLSIILTNPTQIVLGDESEETDSFTQMPNYRWENQSTTDSNIQEQLMGNYYETYNLNNETTGTQPYSKSRELNTRDLYFDSRFMVETGGNETEYFRDVEGDACDFNEGDEEGILSGYVNSHGAENGYLYGNGDGSHTYMYFYARTEEHPNIELSKNLMKDIRIRISATFDFRLTFYWSHSDDFWAYQKSQTQYNLEPNTWHEISFGTVPLSYIINTVNYFRFNVQPTAGGNIPVTDFFYVDWFEITSDFDYATHVEGEIEDTWDWEDSDEYFYKEEDDICDFDEGGTEGWAVLFGDDAILTTSGGWMTLYINDGASQHRIGNTISCDASVYEHFAMEVTTLGGAYGIDTITVYSGSSIVYQDTGNHGVTEQWLVYGDLGLDADWSGTETDLRIYVKFQTDSPSNLISFNFVFLQDEPKGDVEDWLGLTGYYTNPQGYWSMMGQGGTPVVASTGQTIDSNNFDFVKLRIKSVEGASIRIKALQDASQKVVSGLITLDAGEWEEETVDLSLDDDWSGVFEWVGIELSDFASTEHIFLDYFLILGNWSDESQYKFSLLNNEDEEGLSIGFNRFNLTNNDYYLNISVYDSLGIADSFSTTFTYDYSVDGWLFIDFEFDLDKKEIKMLLEYENGTDILKTRAFTDIFSNIGTQQLLLFQSGFPQLCLNASTDSLERVWFLIDYIDASFSTAEWRHPSKDHKVMMGGLSRTMSQDIFDYASISPYGVATYLTDTTALGKEQWFVIDVDRFDGVNFDVASDGSGIDSTDDMRFYFEAYNIHPNGTPELIVTLRWNSKGTPNSFLYAVIRNDSVNMRTLGSDNADQFFESSMSFYYESPKKVVLQTTFDTDTSDLQSTQITVDYEESSGLFTKEWLFYHSFYIETNDGGYADDRLSLKIGGYDLTRKDLLGDIAGMIINPVVDFLSVIFAPVFLLLQFLGFVISRGLKFVVDLLGPLITGVGDATTAAFGALSGVLDIALGAIDDALGVIGGFIEDVGGFIEDVGIAIAGIGTVFAEAINGAFSGFIETLYGLAEEAAGLLLGILDWLFVLLLDSIELAIDLISAGLIFVWNLFGLPDLGPLITQLITMFFDVITGIPQLITDIAEWIFFFGTFGLVLWWAWCVLLPVASLNPGEATGQIMDRFFAGIFPWDILGIHFYIPQGLVMIGLTYFLIIAPTGTGFAIW